MDKREENNPRAGTVTKGLLTAAAVAIAAKGVAGVPLPERPGGTAATTVRRESNFFRRDIVVGDTLPSIDSGPKKLDPGHEDRVTGAIIGGVCGVFAVGTGVVGYTAYKNDKNKKAAARAAAAQPRQPQRPPAAAQPPGATVDRRTSRSGASNSSVPRGSRPGHR